ncbi:hypothetical protein BD413DRAFT_218328 [Trametes elegans]|nr:hypothetical protein BD413DRAFT_218328 [Trametes elegans]
MVWQPCLRRLLPFRPPQIMTTPLVSIVCSAQNLCCTHISVHLLNPSCCNPSFRKLAVSPGLDREKRSLQLIRAVLNAPLRHHTNVPRVRTIVNVSPPPSDDLLVVNYALHHRSAPSPRSSAAPVTLIHHPLCCRRTAFRVSAFACAPRTFFGLVPRRPSASPPQAAGRSGLGGNWPDVRLRDLMTTLTRARNSTEASVSVRRQLSAGAGSAPGHGRIATSRYV